MDEHTCKKTYSRSVADGSPRTAGSMTDERGVALVLALVMLVVLTILGAFALSTSSTELRIVGNFRNSQIAFYAADAAVQYGKTDEDIYTSIVPGSVESWPAGPGTSPVPFADITAQVRVSLEDVGPVPVGSGFSEDVAGDFQAFYFVITAVGSAPNNSTAIVDTMVARMVPK